MPAPVELIDVPEAYLLCLGVGLALSLLAWWKRPPLALRALFFILGQTIVLTMPLLAFLDRYVYGAYPTIDKEGSLLFYLDGVHVRMLLHPWLSTGDPAARLIGVHTGHLWLTAFFDLFLSPVGAFNAQALLSPALAWFAAWLLLRDLCGHNRISLVLAFAWGMGLHLFRDLNWYTIEKAAIFWLALYAWALLRAWERTPAPRSQPELPRGRLSETGPWPWIAAALFVLMAWNNLYLGLVGAALAAMALPAALLHAVRQRSPLAAARARALGLSCVAATLFVAPLLLLQGLLLSGGATLGDPELFLHQRAALDSFTLVPFSWNRLEPWRALNLVVVGLSLFGAWARRDDPRVRFALVAGLGLFLLSLGPFLLPGVQNPVYMGLRAVVPGFWRIAKPEVFFHGTWLLMCGIAAVELARHSPRTRGMGTLYLLFVLGWLLMVRTHPVYPEMNLPRDSQLAPDWQDKVFK